MVDEDLELASSISYEVIKDIAPKELPFFDDFKEKFVQNPNAFTQQKPKERERMLGFGFPDPATVTQILTGFVLPIVLQIIKTHGFKQKENKTPSSDQLKEIRTEAYSNAVAMGMDSEKAGIMADALVGKISVSGLL